jgi:DNA-binding MarR family transcriptional regulator
MNDCLTVCNQLKAAASCSERVLNDALSELGVSHCQATVLQKVATGPLPMSDVSKAMCCHKSNVTQVVGGLLKKGLLERTARVSDRRVFELRLTNKGKTVVQNLSKILRDRACSCMSVFTAVEKKTFASLLEKYICTHRPT